MESTPSTNKYFDQHFNEIPPELLEYYEPQRFGNPLSFPAQLQGVNHRSNQGVTHNMDIEVASELEQHVSPLPEFEVDNDILFDERPAPSSTITPTETSSIARNALPAIDEGLQHAQGQIMEAQGNTGESANSLDDVAAQNTGQQAVQGFELSDFLLKFQSAEEAQFRSSSSSDRHHDSALAMHHDSPPTEPILAARADPIWVAQPRLSHSNTRTRNTLSGQGEKQLPSPGSGFAPHAHGPRRGRVPFEDVQRSRHWFVNHSNDRVQAAILIDSTIPYGLAEKQQKRTAANSLRVAFEAAQPVGNDKEFHILDTICLELVEDVVLFHLFGDLTARYTSGKSKSGPTTFNSFDEHIDILAQVLGTQDCAKARSIRKRLTDAPYRKRLIDNPLSEIALVEKNKEVNDQRRLKFLDTKAQAAQAEELKRELEELKSKVAAPYIGPHLFAPDFPNGLGDDKLLIPRAKSPCRPVATPRRPCSRLSAEKGASVRQAPSLYLDSPTSAASYSLGSSISLPYSVNQHRPVPDHSTINDTHGPSAAKKPRFASLNTMQQPLIRTARQPRLSIIAKDQQASQIQGMVAQLAQFEPHQASAAVESDGNCTSVQQPVATSIAALSEDSHNGDQLQGALVNWFEPRQIGKESGQEDLAELNQMCSRTATVSQAETIAALPNSSNFPSAITPGAGGSTAQNMPDFDAMMSDKLPDFANMSSEEFSRFFDL